MQHKTTPEFLESQGFSATFETRFWKKVKAASANECWEWKASISTGGYGKLGVAGKGSGWIAASRASWIIHNGAIDGGLFVCHTCDNRKCVNPNHLFLGAHQDNMDDCHEKGRYSTGHSHGMVSLTDEDYENIRSMFFKGGATRGFIASFFVTSITNVGNVIRGKHWTAVYKKK